jgi:hydroxymethylbilane synthase
VTAASSHLRLGTRGSQLALWQANAVAARVREAGGPDAEIVVIKTSGDQLQQVPISEVGGKAVFVKEIEEALLAGEVDLAVHSSKDLPAVSAAGLSIAAVLPREDPLDAVVLPEKKGSGFGPLFPMGDESVIPEASTVSRTVDSLDRLLVVLGESPVIGTGSVRRVAQLRRLFPHARFKQIRGNLDTRLRKLENGEYDALVLAAAGLRRLGFASKIAVRLPAPSCVPAPGQGIVAVQTREHDERVLRHVAPIDDREAHAALRAERAVVEALGGGCQAPIGAFARPAYPAGLELAAVVLSLDGNRAVYGMAQGSIDDADAIGARVGARLLADGARGLLEEAERQGRES